MDENETQQGDMFRHVAFFASIVLLLGAWKFAIEGIVGD